jgi:hypothetical protein
MSRILSITPHKLRDVRLSGWRDQIAGRWHYRDLAADAAWRDGWISFDAVTWNPDDGLVYCGLNSIDGDLLYTFDPRSRQFTCRNTRAWTDAFDVKIHRTLLHNPRDGCLYFATSLLHDIDQQREAPGGKLVRYDPRAGAYELLAIPVPRLYVQSIAADWERGILYSFTYPAEAVVRTDLRTRQSEILAWIGNSILFAQPHNSVVDREGWLWGTCAETRAWDELPGPQPVRLFKYHPDGDRFVWFDYGLPRAADPRQLLPDPPKPAGAESALAETRHTRDYGFCDSMAYDGERYIYAGTVAGVLARIDTQTGAVEKVAHVMATGRFPALAFRDGVLYGGGGMNRRTQLIRWDTRTDLIESFPDLTDSETGETPARIHELAVAGDGTRFLGENDNHHRSSYLWSVRLG